PTTARPHANRISLSPWSRIMTPAPATRTAADGTTPPTCSRTPLPCCALSSPILSPAAIAPSAGRHWQRPDPPEHQPEQASGQVTLRQQQPVVPRVFHQTPASLDEALLQAGQRPGVDSLRQHMATPQVAQVVG